MKLKKLILKNFLTYEFLDYSFQNKPLLVQGLNLTDDNQKTNGTGKSGLQTGIEFALTASNSRGVRDVELINYEEDIAEVELFIKCDVRKEELHIHWKLKRKGSNLLSLKIIKDDVISDVPMATVNHGKEFITNWIGISKEDLFNYFLINKSRFKSFFKSSNKEKVDLINRFSDASILNGVENIDLSELELELSDIREKKNRAEGAIEVIVSDIERLENMDIDDELKSRIKEVDDEIDSKYDEIVDLESSIIIGKQEITELNEEIIDIKNCSYKELDTKKALLEEELEEKSISISEFEKTLSKAAKSVSTYLSTDWDKEREDFQSDLDNDNSTKELVQDKNENLKLSKNKAKVFIEKLNNSLESSITCPKCSHEFVLKSDITVDEMKEKVNIGGNIILDIDKKLRKNEADFNSIVKSIRSLESDLSKINTKEREENDELSKLQSNVNKCKEDLNNRTTELSAIQSKIDSHSHKVERLDLDIEKIKGTISEVDRENSVSNTKIDFVRSKIRLLNESKLTIKAVDNSIDIDRLTSNKKTNNKLIDSLEIDYDKIAVRLNDKKEWINNFKQFKMYLANQSLEVIAYHSNRYLRDMGSDMQVKFDGFKVLSNGTVKEEITAKIIRDRERTFSSFSGGEQGRLLFASILANRHMINETHEFGGLDFLSIDEVFEGVDSMGLRLIINSSKHLGIPVMIVTHVSDDETSDDILLIVKENNKSFIRE